MKNTFNKQELERILKPYNLGKLKEIGKVLKDDNNSFCQIIKTSKQKLVLKLFRRLSNSEKEGISLSQELLKKGYPSNKIFRKNNGNLISKYQGKSLIIMKYSDPKGWDSGFNKYQMKEFGKNLAKFHSLSSRKQLQTGDEWKDLKENITKCYKYRNKYSKETKNLIEFMRKNVNNLKCPKNEFISGHFSEYNPGHVSFSDNKLSAVLDWDVSRDYAFYDLASSSVACFKKSGKLDFGLLKNYLDSYNKARKLSEWEKNHVLEALMFGCFKYATWEILTGSLGEIHMSKLRYIVNLSEREKTLIKGITY